MRKCLFIALLLVIGKAEAEPNLPAEPRVTVRAAQPLASEPGNNSGLFTIYRSGETNAAVTVSFTLSGSASNGVDYAAVPTSLTLAAGQLSSNVVISPIAESSATEYKKVDLTLDAGHGSYVAGFLRRAVVYIAYNYTNAPPEVRMVTPTNGTSFLSRPNIELAANASDSNGWVATVEFYANGNPVGTVTNYAFVSGPVPAPFLRESHRSVVPIWPGARSGRFQFVWSQVPAGAYSITAVATDNSGLQTTSDAVSIDVSTNLPAPEVRLVNPVDGADFVESAPINIFAAAGETNGVVTSVEFLANGNELGVATNYIAGEPSGQFHSRVHWLPFYFRWTNAPLGSNTITAVVTDNNGTTANSEPVEINVNTNVHRRRW